MTREDPSSDDCVIVQPKEEVNAIGRDATNPLPVPTVTPPQSSLPFFLTCRGRIVSMFKRKSASMRSMSANERSLTLLLEELKKSQSLLSALSKRKETIQSELQSLGTRSPEPFTFDSSSRSPHSLPSRHQITGNTSPKREPVSPLLLPM